jgi:hypothetical protein
MSSLEDKYLVDFQSVYAAVRNYARPEMDNLRYIIKHRLQSARALGMYKNYSHLTQWDEFCHEIQSGIYYLSVQQRHDIPISVWKEMIPFLIDGLIEHISRRSAVLLSIFAAWELNEAENLSGSFWPDGISRVLISGLEKEASDRDLFCFSPWRNGGPASGWRST